MKYFIMILILILIYSCGKDQTNQEDRSTLKHNLYIIGGQSNAAGLIHTLNNTYDINTFGFAEIPFLVNRIIGYAVGGTVIQYWLDSNNNQYLTNLVATYCNQLPYLVWWQGESNATVPMPNFVSDTNSFFIYLKNFCPNLKIIEVIIPNINGNDGKTLEQSLQKSLGDYQISASGYTMLDINHLTQDSYIEFWNKLTYEFPLG